MQGKTQVLASWKEHFEEHLNEGSESEQPTRPVEMRDDGVDIDLPSREELEGVLKYLKNNKAVGADSIVVELLKNGGLNLVDALHAVIHQPLFYSFGSFTAISPPILTHKPFLDLQN
jgi:hypothetical protein